MQEETVSFKEWLKKLVHNESDLKLIFDHVTYTISGAGLIAAAVWAMSIDSSNSKLLNVCAGIICIAGTLLLALNVIFGANKIKAMNISDLQKTLIVLLYGMAYFAFALLFIIQAMKVNKF
ncbi:MAG: hypothetical protein RIC95_10660 [Vicingaceae bacterium]